MLPCPAAATQIELPSPPAPPNRGAPPSGKDTAPRQPLASLTAYASVCPPQSMGRPHRTEISHKILPPDVIRQVSHNPLQKFSLTLPLFAPDLHKTFSPSLYHIPFQKQGPSSQYFLIKIVLKLCNETHNPNERQLICHTPGNVTPDPSAFPLTIPWRCRRLRFPDLLQRSFPVWALTKKDPAFLKKERQMSLPVL